MSIHDELQRIAERAPQVDVPADTWARARRARRRERALVVGAAAAVIALVAGLATWLPTRDRPPVADSTSVGVPDRIYDVREGMAPEADLAVGLGAAAFSSTGRSPRPVVVGAEDGAYHVLRLPDFDGPGAVGTVLSLSPDGTTLAYYAAIRPGETDIRLVDLRDGSVRSVGLPTWKPGLGSLVTGLSWSPAGNWLLWTGQVITGWSPNGGRYGRLAAGRIDADSGSSQILPQADWQGAGIGDDGTVATAGFGNRVLRWDGQDLSRTPVTASDGLFVSPPVGTRVSGVAASRVADIRSGQDGSVVVAWAPAWVMGGTVRESYAVESAQWIDDDTVVALLNSDDAQGYSTYDLGLVTLEGPGATSYRTIATTDVVDDLTLATGLIDPDHPTISRPTPDWVDDGGTSWWLVSGVALAGLALALAVVLRLRRR